MFLPPILYYVFLFIFPEETSSFVPLSRNKHVDYLHPFMTTDNNNNNKAPSFSLFSSSSPFSNLGNYDIKVEKPLGILLEELSEGKGGGVKVLSLIKDGNAEKTNYIAPGDVLLEINNEDVSQSDFDSVMGILTTPTEDSSVSLKFGDGLGLMDIASNLQKTLNAQNQDLFLIDATVREAVREVRLSQKLGDVVKVEIIIGANILEENESKVCKVRFFAIFSTDGITTYSCNVSAKGVVLVNSKGEDEGITITSLTCAKDEGLGQTVDLIVEGKSSAKRS